MQEIYTESFYEKSNTGRFIAAEIILPIVIKAMPSIRSAVDVGCGPGVWLSVLKEKGVDEIHGVDGDWAKDRLVIPAENFRAVNMENGVVEWKECYDLAMSLEVAEHLPKKAAKNFVSSLTSASDFILFSAAIPLQGGKNHINEQWQDYWVELFREHDYRVLDFIRPQIWNNEKIPIWYRQNILFFVYEEKRNKLKVDDSNSPISIVHPQSWLRVEKLKKKIVKHRKISRITLIIGLAVGFLIGFLV